MLPEAAGNMTAARCAKRPARKKERSLPRRGNEIGRCAAGRPARPAAVQGASLRELLEFDSRILAVSAGKMTSRCSQFRKRTATSSWFFARYAFSA